MADETAYDRIEAGIVAALTAEGTPFNKVTAYGAHLSDSDIVDELTALVRVAPAAMVFYGGGNTNEGLAGVLNEDAVFTVLVLAAVRSRAALGPGDEKSPGIYRLIEFCREALHNVAGIDGINNPLLLSRNRRFSIPGHLLTVAAYAVDFRAPLTFPDGP